MIYNNGGFSIMGEMADFFLDDVYEMECLRDEYVDGNMSQQDAYNMGFVNELGYEEENMQMAFDRSNMQTKGDLSNDLNNTIKDFEVLNLRNSASVSIKSKFPKCKICKETMLPRQGKYGKFYYCKNQCEGKKCVNDKYWQKQFYRNYIP